jgi:hypothetical protein
MFIKAKDFDKFLVKVKIEIGEFFGLENAEAYVVFKELDTFNTLKLKEQFEKGEIELLKTIKEMLPAILIDHNFYIDESKKMTNEEVVNLIFDKNTLTTKVVGDYISSVFRLPEQGESKPTD